MGTTIRFLSESQTAAAFPSISETLEILASALAASASGSTDIPTKSGFKPSGRPGFFHWMPFFDRADPAVGIKWVSYIPDNAGRGLVDSHAMMVLFDGDTGYPTGIMGGMEITALRTAGAALLSAKMFCPNPKKLALIGCGRIQKMTAGMFTGAYPELAEVAVYSRTASARDLFCEENGAATGAPFRSCADAASAMADADIVVSCVPQAAQPFLDAKDFKAGAVFVPLDVVASWKATVLEASDMVMCDNRGQLANSLARRADKGPDLSRALLMGDILRGAIGKPAFRRLATSLVTGSAETDLFIARVVLGRARDMNIGTELQFS